MLTIHRFDPSDCGFPPPAVSVLPRFRRASLASAKLEESAGTQRSYSRGRYALRDAYSLCGVGQSGALLAPAYHCRTMIDPAVSLGAEVALYPVTGELKPDMAALARAVAAAAQPVRALLFTHFFGFPRDVVETARFCKEHDITLIEDCSHVWMPAAARAGIATMGRYAVFSHYKYVPSEDGAALRGNFDAPLPSRNRSPSARRELAALARLLGGSRHASLGCSPPPDAAQDSTGECARHWIESTNATSTNYTAADEGMASLRSSSWILRRTDDTVLSQRRRQRYAQWLAGVRNLPGCRPLFPVLPDDCVPYMFPLLLDTPEPYFTRLKYMGMPIWRWDEMAMSDCPTASYYRLRLLHLPCHQELTNEETTWMLSAMARVLTRTS